MNFDNASLENMAFDNIVFAGGGNRCFWQAGFWKTLNSELNLNPNHVASVSAGSAISCAIFSGCMEQTLENTKEVMGRNKKNRYLKNLFNDQDVYPHSALYRQIVKQSLSEQSLKTLHQGPVNHILVAHIPRWLGPKSAVLVGLGAYQLEKKLRQPVHPTYGRKLGFKSEFILSTHCQTVDELCDAMISSSCTPPFTPLMYRNNKPVLDGGMVDNVPVHGVDGYTGNTLVLLSRPYKKLPTISGRVYAQPSRPVDIQSWDYTNPKGVQSSYDQGLEDGFTFLKQQFSR